MPEDIYCFLSTWKLYDNRQSYWTEHRFDFDQIQWVYRTDEISFLIGCSNNRVLYAHACKNILTTKNHDE